MAMDLHRKNDLRKTKRSYSEIMKDVVTEEFPLDPLELLGERSFDDPDTLQELDKRSGSDVQEFYRNSTIFITGGTGFMGKTLIEKLSRSCPDLKHIYLLIRNKKNVAIENRLKAIFDDRVRMYYNTTTVNCRSKISRLGFFSCSEKLLYCGSKRFVYFTAIRRKI